MICLHCDKEGTMNRHANGNMVQEFKGLTLNAQSPGIVCRECGWVSIDMDQMMQLKRSTEAAFTREMVLLSLPFNGTAEYLLALEEENDRHSRALFNIEERGRSVNMSREFRLHPSDDWAINEL